MKFHKKYRNSYWSDSKLLSWMIPKKEHKPFYSVDEVMERLKVKNPLAERVIDKLQDILMLPLDLIYSIKVHLKNCKGNTHVLSAGLEKGQWYDLTYRIPVCLFSELEKFIEQEKGLETHKWEMKLTLNEGWGVQPDSENYGKPSYQALAAIEQNEIYLWWRANKNHEFIDSEDEERYAVEEQEMLIRFVKIYRSLWT